MPENWKFLIEAHKFTDLPQDEIPEIVFWGRSNVGKSSLINSITNLKIAKTSKTPGRTRSLVFFELKGKFRIVDFQDMDSPKFQKVMNSNLINSWTTTLKKEKIYVNFSF